MNPSLRSRLQLVGVLELFAALSALGGGIALILRPDGSLIRMSLAVLQGSPFTSFLIPGLLLGAVVGGSNVVGATLAFLGSARSALAAGVAGFALMIWIGVQLAMLGYIHPLQLIMFTLGLVIVALGAMVLKARGRPTEGDLSSLVL